MTKTLLLASTALLFTASAAFAGDKPQVAEAPVPTGPTNQAPLADASQQQSQAGSHIRSRGSEVSALATDIFGKMQSLAPAMGRWRDVSQQMNQDLAWFRIDHFAHSANQPRFGTQRLPDAA